MRDIALGEEFLDLGVLIDIVDQSARVVLSVAPRSLRQDLNGCSGAVKSALSGGGLQVLTEGCSLGILPGVVRRFRFEDRPHPPPKVPHKGWNRVDFLRPHPLLEGIESGTHFYFVHSYYPAPSRTDSVLGRTEYAGTEFAAILDAGNAVATQFHTEKSGEAGLRILSNFAKWRP